MKRNRQIATGVTLLLLGGALMGLAANPVQAQSRKAYPLPASSQLAGIDVGKMTPSEAAERIDTLWTDYRDVAWTLFINETEYRVTPATLGLAPNRARMVSNLQNAQSPPANAWQHVVSWFVKEPAIVQPLELALDQATFDAWITTMRPQVEIAAVDAYVDWNARTIVPGVQGIRIDKGTWQGVIDDSLTTLNPRRIELPVLFAKPSVTKADLAGLSLETPFASYTTSFNARQTNRTKNIAQAVSRWDGVVLPPAESVSFNEIVGKRNEKNGFFVAPVYENRRVSEGFGGGICQVSTTLYNTALLAGFEIEKRGGHSRPCSYAPPGRDATVDWPSRDLMIKNPHPFPVFVNAVVEGGTVTFTFFGDPSQKPVIELEHEVTWLDDPGEPTMVLDTSLPAGTQQYEDKGFGGRKIVVTRVWNAGTENERREIISTDRIRALHPIIRYHPQDEAPVTQLIVEPERGDDGEPLEGYF